MEQLLDFFGVGATASGEFLFQAALVNLLLAFVLGQLAAWMYVYTHSGMSYSRNFVQSIILLTMIVTLAMMVIGNNIVIAFGLLGALTVIRFRNILKDTRDTAFIFFSLVVGMASGTGSHSLAVYGTVVFCLVLLYLHWTSFGSRFTDDSFLRFQVRSETPRKNLQDILRKHSRNIQMVSQRLKEDGSGEIAYRLSMRDPERVDEFLSDLRELQGLSQLTFVSHEEQAEI